MDRDDILLTVRQAAELLGRSESSIRQAILHGRVEAVRTARPRRVRVPLEAIRGEIELRRSDARARDAFAQLQGGDAA